jgi:hypothetical protein
VSSPSSFTDSWSHRQARIGWGWLSSFEGTGLLQNQALRETLCMFVCMYRMYQVLATRRRHYHLMRM